MYLCNCLCTDNTKGPSETGAGDAASQSSSAGGGKG